MILQTQKDFSFADKLRLEFNGSGRPSWIDIDINV